MNNNYHGIFLRNKKNEKKLFVLKELKMNIILSFGN